MPSCSTSLTRLTLGAATWQIHDTIQLMEALRELPSAVGDIDHFFVHRVAPLKLHLSPALASLPREEAP